MEPSSCQLERERAFRAEQLVLRLQAQAVPQEQNYKAMQNRITQLEEELKAEQTRNFNSGGFNSLKAENDALQRQLGELQMQMNQLSRADIQQPPQQGRMEQPVNYLPGVEPITEDKLRMMASQGATAVAVITCKRPQYLQRAMTSFTTQRGDAQANLYPFIISQDAFDSAMTQLVQNKYVATGVAFHMHHEHDPAAPQIAQRFGKKALGYVRIAQHYGFVMKRVFDDFGFSQVIFLEEDMEVAPDFFSYFSAMKPLLSRDPNMFCISAWNDNGYSSLVHDSRSAFRTEFFPGLGWMMDRRIWAEVRDRWAVAYWDEFMRRPDVRQGRHCIRPEVSRSFTFGEQGTSGGQFFKTHLSKIRLNEQPVDWANQDTSFLASQESFDAHLTQELRQAAKVELWQADQQARPGVAIRIEYDDKMDYKRVAAKFGLMPDEKEGIRRMSYRGVIPFSWRDGRVFLYTRNWPPGLDP